MKLTTFLIAVVLCLSLCFSSDAVFAEQQEENPASVWCDYHNASFIKNGVEFPNGVCYDVYTHTYYDRTSRSTRTHKMTIKCPRSSGR